MAQLIKRANMHADRLGLQDDYHHPQPWATGGAHVIRELVAALVAASNPAVASDLVQRLRDEADLCRNETADDIAKLLDEAATALAAAPAAAPAWQPIETAPKDGTAVLVWRRGWALPAIAYYSGRRWGPTTGYAFRDAPTHWLPLPEAPGFQAPATGDASHG